MDDPGEIPAALRYAYADRFHGPIPVGPWHGDAEIARAAVEAQRALDGERGPLTAEEFPLDCPPGTVA